MKKRKYWAGFCDGRIVSTTEELGDNDEVLAIYPRKKDASKYYQDVRPIEIKELKTK